MILIIYKMDRLTYFISNSKKPIYIYGKSGCGKTTMLNKLQYSVKFISIQDIVSYEELIVFAQPTILQQMSNINLKHICVIDNIDYLQNNDKKILSYLLKQFKMEDKKKSSRNFTIILCGTNYYDKKIKEIMKYCNVINITSNTNLIHNQYEKNIQNSIKKIMNKEFNEDFIIDNEKATQSLLFHENIIDLLKTDADIMFYKTFLKNYCIGDYFDRISFQKQLWIFNEITYYFKILHNYYLYNKTPLKPKKNIDFRFTKVLTKYSNEYNNNIFIINICNQLNCSKKELFYLLLNKQTPTLTTIEINRAVNYFQIKKD
jgi:chromosomal replication initiation ATPase DnaA